MIWGLESVFAVLGIIFLIFSAMSLIAYFSKDQFVKGSLFLCMIISTVLFFMVGWIYWDKLLLEFTLYGQEAIENIMPWMVGLIVIMALITPFFKKKKALPNSEEEKK